MQINKKILTGIVIQDASDKTINILVETYKNHPLYKKRTKYSKKYLVHDEKNIAKIGDKVSFISTRPISKNKSFKLLKVIKKAVN